MRDYKKTRGYFRFSEFLESIKKADTEKDVLLAGFNLVNLYGGFNYQHRVKSTLEIIDKMIENDKRTKEEGVLVS